MLLNTTSCLDGYAFGLEIYKKRWRFVIFYNKEEIACRKEEVKVLTSFFQSTDTGIFQGRIKLNTDNDKVVVFFKGQCLGTIAKKELNKVMSSLITI